MRTRLDIIFFFQAEDGIRDYKVTGVQTCALPISLTLHDTWVKHREETEKLKVSLRQLNDKIEEAKRSEEHTSELQSPCNLVCRLLLEKKKTKKPTGLAEHSHERTNVLNNRRTDPH